MLGLLHQPASFGEFLPQTDPPRTDIVTSLIQGAIEINKTGISPKIEVIGEYTLEGPGIYTQELIFHPNSKLVLTGQLGQKNEKTIIANKIEVRGTGTQTGQITWVRDVQEPRVPIAAGKAVPGENGRFEGEDGFRGPDGVIGNTGYPGRSAPNLVIIFSDYSGSPLKVDLNGQKGGNGGQGQNGGDGGLGRPGKPSINSLFDCRASASRGGNGGQGGVGGKGGTGGRGGDGGTLAVFVLQEKIELAKQSFDLTALGGSSGEPGQGGFLGVGGKPGPKGRTIGACTGGATDGNPGSDGTKGEPGANGIPGLPGEFRVTPLAPERAKATGLNLP